MGGAVAEPDAFLSSLLGKGFPDNADLRKQFWTSLITAPKENVFSFKERILPTRAGQVRIRGTKRQNDFLVQFQNGSGGVFPDATQGSYSIVRDLSTGYFIQVKIFLQDDPGCYIRLYPQAEATRADVVMYGALVKRGLYISGLIYYVLALPFSTIVEQTRSSFDWSTVFGRDHAGPGLALADGMRNLPPARLVQASMPVLGPVSLSLPPSGQVSLLPQAQSAAADPARTPAGAQPDPSPVGLAADGLAPSPLVAQATWTTSIATAVFHAASLEGLASGLSAQGETVSELGDSAPSASTPGSGPAPKLAALGLSDDGDPFVPRLPYKNFPRYEPGKGVALSGLRALLYLDSLQSYGGAYAVIGDSLRLLALPYFDGSGHYRMAFFADGKELAWPDVAASKDLRVRVLRFWVKG